MLKQQAKMDEPIPELGGLTAEEAEAKLDRWYRLKSQRSGIKKAEEKIKEEFKSFDLDLGTHQFGAQLLRVSPWKRVTLDEETLIYALLDRFGEDFAERFLVSTEDGKDWKPEFRSEFKKVTETKSYSPQGRA